MKKVFGFLGSRWFLSLLGTAALAALIWFAGPLFAFAGRVPLEPERTRWIVIGALFGIWALVQIVAALAARLRNRKLMDQLAATPEPPPDPARVASAEESETLRQRFDEALAVLKESEGRRRLGGQWVYQLPWYLIIGPPGCGKTTALVNSGLRFPLAERFGQDPIHGIGGTRNCDWWFTEQAVLLDTAGRYTTQDSYAQVDSAAWGAFLGLLKRHRPRRPINGVLVAMSLSDLMQQSEAERTAHSRAIRQRLQEIHNTLGIRPPVYMIFMKADLVAGFNEFFADLGQEGRTQVWGMTFPFDDGKAGTPAIAGFAAGHRALAERLGERLLDRMQQERDPSKRALVFSFPRQVAALGEPIERFLNDTFAPTRFESRPLIRGVYFTSGTQTGAPIDRVLAAIAANFGMGGRSGALPFRGTPKSFFVTRLLQDLAFPEAALASLDPRVERRRLWRRRGAYAGAAAIALLAGLAWTGSYLRNRAYVAEVAADTVAIGTRIDALPAKETDPLALLPILDAARAIPGGYADRDRGAPLTMGLGLYQGDKLGSQAELTYRRLLHRALLPRAILRLEDQIRAGGADPDYLYDALRIYLMLDDPGHYDPQAVQRWVNRDWERNLPRETGVEQQAALRGHLAALLEEPPTPLPLALDGELVASAREILNAAPLADRLYGRLKREGLGEGFADFRIAAAAGDLAPRVLDRASGKPLTEGVPALYTYDGYSRGLDPALHRLLDAAAAESWVLGPHSEAKPGSAEAKRLIGQVRERYLQDYAAQWEALLADIRLVPARDLPHAAEIARLLADPKDSPLRRLLVAAADQTELDRPPPDPGRAAAAVGGQAGQAAGTLSGLRDRVEQYFGDARAAATPQTPATDVTRRFAWLRELVRGTPERPAPIDKAQQGLAQLELYLKSVAAAMVSGRPILATGEGNEIRAAKEAIAQLPGPVSAMVGTLVQDSANLVSGGARARIDSLWTAQVLPFCREAIGERYPFARASRRDTTLADFGRLFGPGGLLDAFFTENLQPLVNSAKSKWTWVDGGIGIPDSVLAQFQRAARIREAFFAAGGKLPSASFELTPIALDARATRITLDIGGQVLDYRQGPLKTQAFQWPAPDGTPRARYEIVGTESNPPAVSETGAWAWFRLLDRARLQPTGQEELFRVVFASGGLAASFELRAASVRNPFALDELRGFQCPERL